MRDGAFHPRCVEERHKTGTLYIDFALTYFGIIRVAPGLTPNVNSGDSNNITNTTKETGISGYSKDQIYLYWNDEWAVPTWGNGN